MFHGDVQCSQPILDMLLAIDNHVESVMLLEIANIQINKL